MVLRFFFSIFIIMLRCYLHFALIFSHEHKIEFSRCYMAYADIGMMVYAVGTCVFICVCVSRFF